MKQVRVHMIADDEMMTQLSVTTKLIPVPQILARLKEAGRQAAGRFLAEGKENLGVRSSVDLPAMFS